MTARTAVFSSPSEPVFVFVGGVTVSARSLCGPDVVRFVARLARVRGKSYWICARGISAPRVRKDIGRGGTGDWMELAVASSKPKKAARGFAILKQKIAETLSATIAGNTYDKNPFALRNFFFFICLFISGLCLIEYYLKKYEGKEKPHEK